MTGFDVRAVSQELDLWAGAYVKKAYMPHYEQIVLRINPKGMDPRVASLLTGGDPDSDEITREFVQYDEQNKLWRLI